MAVNLKPKDLPAGYSIKAEAATTSGFLDLHLYVNEQYAGKTVRVPPSDVKKEKALEAAVAEVVELAKAREAHLAERSASEARDARKQKAAEKIADKLNKS